MTTFSGGCDGQVRMWNPSQGTGSVQVIGKHDQPIKNMKYLANHNVLVTGSWDKSVRCTSKNNHEFYCLFPNLVFFSYPASIITIF